MGQSFARLLMAQEKELAFTYGLVPQVVGIMDSSGWSVDEHGIDLKKALRVKKETGKVAGMGRRDYASKKAAEMIRDMEAEVLIEATPTNFKTGEPGFSHMKAAFESKKHVVTCNKGPLSIAYYALHELARHNGVQLRFSGAVGGGTPVLDFGKTCSMGDRLIGMRGILNGTCNYILTRMEQEGVSFDEALDGGEEGGVRGGGPLARHRRVRQRGQARHHREPPPAQQGRHQGRQGERDQGDFLERGLEDEEGGEGGEAHRFGVSGEGTCRGADGDREGAPPLHQRCQQRRRVRLPVLRPEGHNREGAGRPGDRVIVAERLA